MGIGLRRRLLSLELGHGLSPFCCSSCESASKAALRNVHRRLPIYVQSPAPRLLRGPGATCDFLVSRRPRCLEHGVLEAVQADVVLLGDLSQRLVVALDKQSEVVGVAQADELSTCVEARRYEFVRWTGVTARVG